MKHLLRKRLVALCVLFCAIAPTYGQSYSQLWKNVTKAQQDDLPATALKQVDRITAMAQTEGNAGQLLKSLLARHELAYDIAPDSAAWLLPSIEQRLRTVSQPVERALYHVVAGWLYQRLNRRVHEQAHDSTRWHLAQALEAPDALGQAKASDYLPLIEQGRDRQIFHDDVLNVVVRFCTAMGDEQLASEALRKAIAYYRRTNQREAELFMQIDAFTRNDQTDSLKALIDRFGDLKSGVEIYIALAQSGPAAERWKWVEEGIQRYPKAARTDILRNQRAMMSQPELDLRLHHSAACPNDSVTASVSSRNLRSARLCIYQTQLTSRQADAYNLSPSTFDKLTKKLVQAVPVALPKGEVFETVHGSMTFAAPTEGVYVIRLESDGATSRPAFFNVTRQHAMYLNLPDQTACIVVSDRKTGAPIQGAEVRLYNHKRTLIQTLRTNDRGEAPVAKDYAQCTAYVSCNGVETAPALHIIRYGSARTFRPQTNTNISLYTDRAIYRPGQQVYVGGFVYQQRGDSTFAVAGGDSLEIKLLDANRQKMAATKVLPDRFGNISAQFTLPASCLSGMFQIQTPLGFQHFQVEQYKRPTFEVTLRQPEVAYKDGDTLTVWGEVKTFAGFAMPNARVAVQMTRRALPWGARLSTGTSHLHTDTVATDADGRFNVRLPLQTGLADDAPGFCMFTVEAVATSADGESQSGTLHLYAGNREVYLQTDLAAELCKDYPARFCINRRNAAGKALPGAAAYQILRQGRVMAEGTWAFGDTLSTDVFAQLPSGQYTLRVLPAEAQDTLVILHHAFTLFALSDATVTEGEPLQFYVHQTDLPTQGELPLRIATPLKDATIHYNVFADNRLIASELLTLSQQSITKTFSYKPEYGNGLYITAALVHDGQTYIQHATLTKPKPDKALQLRWTTFRDHLQPSQQETWTLRVTDSQGRPASASIMATLYDASLNQFARNDWHFNLYFDRTVIGYNWHIAPSTASWLHLSKAIKTLREPTYEWSTFCAPLQYGWASSYAMTRGGMYRTSTYDTNSAKNLRLRGKPLMAKQASGNIQEAVVETAMADMAAPMLIGTIAGKVDESEEQANGEAAIPVRTDFNETAFFLPTLQTDAQGEATLRFTLPESLTSWQFQALAHTEDIRYGSLQQTIVASKPFMVQPNMPRFLRVGDATTLAATVRNASEATISGRAQLTLTDAATGRVVAKRQATFHIAPQGEDVLEFPIPAIADGTDLFIVRITAQTDAFSDGEQRYLPVLSDKQLVQQSLPLTLSKRGEQAIDLSSLFDGKWSKAAQPHLTFEYTARPANMVAEALPSLSMPLSDNAVALATAYYALSLAETSLHDILKHRAATLDELTTDTLQRLLERNEDLKQTLLTESPWVAAAQAEAERLAGLKQLADPVLTSYRKQSYLDKLLALQNGDGAWSWFKGMPGSAWMTLDVCETLALLADLQPDVLNDARVKTALRHAETFLDKDAKQEEQELRKLVKQQGRKDITLPTHALRYLYYRALRGLKPEGPSAFFLSLLDQSTARYDMYDKALAAVVLNHTAHKQAAQMTLQSLMEHTVASPAMGRYFDTERAPRTFRSYRIPTQVAALTALHELTPGDTAAISTMTQWLLQAKRTQTWDNPRASVDAIHCLLSHTPTTRAPLPTTARLKLRGRDIQLLDGEPDDNTLGYIRRDIPTSQFTAQPKQLILSKPTDDMAFGAVHAQWTTTLSEAEATGSDFRLAVSYYIKVGNAWQPLTSATTLHKGDLVRAKYLVTAARNMDFVSLIDPRPACCEPTQPLSGYDWQTGAYRQVGDTRCEFFFDRLAKGDHIVELTYRIDRTGTFRSGLPSVQCVYAPEFSARAKSITLNVR